MAEDKGTEDTGTEEGTEDEEGTEETGTEEGTEDYKAPDQAEWSKTTTALAKIKAERTKLRRELAEARKATEAKDDKDKDEAAKPDPELRVKTVAVTAALMGAGLTRAQAKRAAKLVDPDDVDVDPDGDADLDDVIADLRSDFPGLFAGTEAGSRATARPRTSGGRSRDGGVTKTADEKNTDALLKAAGYR